MGGNRFLSLIVVLLLAGVGAYFLFPGFRTKVNDTVSGMTAWDAEARRNDPVGFIDYATKALGKNIDKFEAARTDLAVASKKLARLKEETQGKQAFAATELETFKASYKAAKASGTWPTTVAGRAYKEGELKSQVSILLTQRNGYENVVKQADASLTNANNKGNELLNQISESKAKLDILKLQRELVKVHQLTAETEKLLAEVNDVLLENEALAEKPAVRTVEELMRDAGQGPGGSNPDVDAFLNG